VRALDWARLLRISLAPSAAADVAAGIVVGRWGRWPAGPEPWIAIGASLAVYHGGMALNDWADREADRRSRPERPIPSGAISARTALVAAWTLELGAVAIAAAISWSAVAWIAGLGALVVAYDLLARGAWAGPLLLGACRAANLGFGLLFAGALGPTPDGIVPDGAALLALLYGAYVVCASRVARLEDLDDEHAIGASPRAWLAAAALLLCAPAFVDPYEAGLRSPDPIVLTLGVAGAASLAWTALRTKRWTRADAGRATGLALRRLLVFTACVALLGRRGGDAPVYVALAILAGFPISAALRRVIPPT
jgi:4-hydroxybenzoate polyprenyltransferase